MTARKEQLALQIEALNEALANGSTEVKSYRFDAGESNQQMVYRTLQEIIDAIKQLESMYRWVCARLAGTGIHTLRLARRP